MKLFKFDEYRKLTGVDMNILTFFICFKTYFFVMFVGLICMVKLEIFDLDIVEDLKFIKIVITICALECVLIAWDLLNPILYNLIVFVKKKVIKCKKEE
jgi:hypothetical protein